MTSNKARIHMLAILEWLITLLTSHHFFMGHPKHNYHHYLHNDHPHPGISGHIQTMAAAYDIHEPRRGFRCRIALLGNPKTREVCCGKTHLEIPNLETRTVRSPYRVLLVTPCRIPTSARWCHHTFSLYVDYVVYS